MAVMTKELDSYAMGDADARATSIWDLIGPLSC